MMPTNMPKFQVNTTHPSETYGIDVADIQGKSHLVCVDYKSCCIFEHQISGLLTSEIVKALKSTFCDVRAPDKIISDNARYFTSEEFQEFTMQWLIQHITSSPRFLHGNAHTEKAVHIVKQIYHKVSDIKLALLLLKTTPISNRSGTIQDPPASVFFGRWLKAHLPIFQCHKLLNTCNDNDKCANPEVPSKYGKGQSDLVKLDPNTKWMPGKIEQVLPNQSYVVTMSDGHTFQRMSII